MNKIEYITRSLYFRSRETRGTSWKVFSFNTYIKATKNSAVGWITFQSSSCFATSQRLFYALNLKNK